jgi:hypothetical protein
VSPLPRPPAKNRLLAARADGSRMEGGAPRSPGVSTKTLGSRGAYPRIPGSSVLHSRFYSSNRATVALVKEDFASAAQPKNCKHCSRRSKPPKPV